MPAAPLPRGPPVAFEALDAAFEAEAAAYEIFDANRVEGDEMGDEAFAAFLLAAQSEGQEPSSDQEPSRRSGQEPSRPSGEPSRSSGGQCSAAGPGAFIRLPEPGHEPGPDEAPSRAESYQSPGPSSAAGSSVEPSLAMGSLSQEEATLVLRWRARQAATDRARQAARAIYLTERLVLHVGCTP